MDNSPKKDSKKEKEEKPKSLTEIQWEIAKKIIRDMMHKDNN